ncbi:VOC family protein [Pseudaminobacter sp. 19-2017]|uniref:VOC family protein n=1 Tax=Pseudaminobacter soli (ex Zhang et al. 2022) TaxID=2831468 RepID=A0A942I343_9HYPH|nr:VOC family protein [Pseudaminobacter soli]MBS3649369.1 VOC family protein [Pseudaminobacter soli]
MTRLENTEAPRIFPTFRYQDAARMIDWLVQAFGFEVRAKYMDGNRVGHAELALGSSMIMLGSVRDDGYGQMVGEPGANGGKSVYIAVDDADVLCERARAAGARIIEEPVDRDYGSRDFICADPEGNIWCFGTYWPKAGESA